MWERCHNSCACRRFFDEEGNYVENKEKGGAQDAWMQSDEAKVVSEEVRER